jgi:hypothetical protein
VLGCALCACSAAGRVSTTTDASAVNDAASPAADREGSPADVARDAAGSLDANQSQPVQVQPGSCPSVRESVAGKINHQAYLQANPLKEHAVAVWLRQASLPAVPACPNDSALDARCASRNAMLLERQQLNVQQLDCTLRTLGSRVTFIQPVWYESPYHLTSGQPVSIGVAFNVALTWSQIELVGQHPFVELIEPRPGHVAEIGVPAPLSPADCPMEREAPLSKLDRIASIKGQGRQPVVVEVKDRSFLPPNLDCPAGSSCPEAVNVLWERTILNTRQMTCLRRWLDAVLTQQPPDVPFSATVGTSAPVLAPFGQAPATVKAFGQGVTWEEAMKLAEHPYVESIWTAPGIQFDSGPPPGCPPDLSAPIRSVDCPLEQDSAMGKIIDADRMQFARTTGPHSVIIGIKGGSVACPLPPCSAPPCPERDSYVARRTAENLASQRCVRELIAAIGGSGDPDTSWLINAFGATLTWDQIQTVAAHKHVTRVEASNRNIPPP